jgi:ParB-like chromosome segregation protein Spo0J
MTSEGLLNSYVDGEATSTIRVLSVHHRIKAMEQLGATNIPVAVPVFEADHLLAQLS